jgi:GNAT superfamily N-acetyltransferase
MYLTDQRKDGSVVHDSLHNLNFFRGYFDSYVMGSRFGFCLLWYPEDDPTPRGLLLAGEFFEAPALETDLGKVGKVWGVYVEPEHRGEHIGKQLEAYALPLGLKMGFESIETTVRSNNPAGLTLDLGQEPYGIYYCASIRKTLNDLKEKQNG